jgi:hypothetical protein
LPPPLENHAYKKLNDTAESVEHKISFPIKNSSVSEEVGKQLAIGLQNIETA